jgi:hypothetical protein
LQTHEGFVALQVRFNGCATVTISKDNPAEIKADLLGLGLTEAEADSIMKDAGRRFLAAMEDKPQADNTPGPKAAPDQELGPKCGHGVPRAKRNNKQGGHFWSCVAKDNNGDFLWKKGEGCKILDYEEGLKILNG